MKSNVLKSVEQGQLPLVRPVGKVAIQPEIVFAQPTLLGAINLCINASGLDKKELYLPLAIDKGHWTRICSGDAHFPVDKLNDLMDLCGNDAPLVWLANSRGMGLVMLQSEAERMIAERDAQIARMQIEMSIYKEIAGVRQ